jgi:hypothetical protein
LLFVLLPQLAVAGLGSGVVLCVAPGDHLQVELSASRCCESELQADLLPADETLGSRPEQPPACPSCEDVEILADATVPGRQGVHAPAPPPSLAVAFVALPLADGFLRPRIGWIRAAAHLSPLRSIVIRC